MNCGTEESKHKEKIEEKVPIKENTVESRDEGTRPRTVTIIDVIEFLSREFVRLETSKEEKTNERDQE